MRINVFILSIIFSVSLAPSTAQSPGGLPFVTSFPPKVYGHGTQNFAAVQDQTGIMYFGNSNGVLTYDGHEWELVEVSNQSEVHALAVSSDGTIYVGAQGDFGFLEKGPQGELIYRSLLEKVPVADRDFNDVWNIHILETGRIIFRATSALFIYQSGKITTIPLSASSHRSFQIGSELFVWLEFQGLFRFINDSLQRFDDNLFTREAIHAILPYEEEKRLIISRNSGFFVQEKNSFKPVMATVGNLMKGENMTGILLRDGSYAIGTRTKGLVIVDRTGKIVLHLDATNGPINQAIWSICEDRFTGNLWLATNNGIFFIDKESPFSHYNVHNSSPVQTYHLAWHKGNVYAATSAGVQFKAGPEGFEPHPSIKAQSWHFYNDGELLLVATNDGVFEIDGARTRSVGFTGRA